jgi:hypothetical protein
MVHRYWGLSKLNDYDTGCGAMSQQDIQGTVKKCKNPQPKDQMSVPSFIWWFRYGFHQGGTEASCQAHHLSRRPRRLQSNQSRPGGRILSLSKWDVNL